MEPSEKDGKLHCPSCDSLDLTEPRGFNLMFKTHTGPVADDGSVAYLRPEKILITRFVHGKGLPVEQMRTPEMSARVAATLRRLHSGPPVRATFAAVGLV